MNRIEDLRLSKNMKYEALYYALGFLKLKSDKYSKLYNNDFLININTKNQTVDFDNRIVVVNTDVFKLNTHKSFVILECIDKLLNMRYKPSEIIIDVNNEYDIYVKDLYIKCFEWGYIDKNDDITPKQNTFKSIRYSSRLASGLIERKTFIKDYSGNVYDYGIFENEKRLDKYTLCKGINLKSSDFEIEKNILIKCNSKSKKIIIPEKIIALNSCLFWDNQNIEEVVLPKSLINLGGDTFYNCKNLKKIVIPENVKYMGNNPFAGCPDLELINKSLHFKQINGALYSIDYSRLIYYPIKKINNSYKIEAGTEIIGKHAFFLCNNLEVVTIPGTVIRLENNPFSGCDKLDIINNSPVYHVKNKVIYDKDYSSVIGCLNSISTSELKLLPVKRICRNAFWNCKGINKIILPDTLKDIGYNPFVGCSNIEFVNNSKNFTVEKGVLYTKDKSKLICYPAKNCIGDIYLPDEVITLERGAFSGCDKMTNINLHNISVISKTCFTNCNSLKRVYCCDLVTYIGEWAFAHCDKLEELSVYKECFIDNNALINSNVELIKRDNRSNYVIESDNIYTLKSMLKSYKEKFKSILIDPPYNSHINNIGYNDSLDDTYENFIKERIQLSYELLFKDGFLVINIDEGEAKNLSNICKKIFKKVEVHKWEKLHPFFDINRDVDPNKKKIKYEYIIICFKTNESIMNTIKQPYIEENKIFEKDATVPNDFSCFGTNSSAKDEIYELFGSRTFFSTPKPVKLIKELIRATTTKESLVMDYFAGSGTLAQSVIELNKEDNGDRHYILISNNESNICKNITIKRASKFDDSVVFLKSSKQ